MALWWWMSASTRRRCWKATGHVVSMADVRGSWRLRPIPRPGHRRGLKLRFELRLLSKYKYITINIENQYI